MKVEEGLRIMTFVEQQFDGSSESAARVAELIDRLLTAPEEFWHRFEGDMAQMDGLAQSIEELLKSGGACARTTPEEFGKLTGYLITQRPAKVNPNEGGHD